MLPGEKGSGMGRNRILITVLAAAALFGAAISGCNRNREPRLADASQRRGARPRSRSRAETTEYAAPVRPAEVLSASARRMAPMRRTARQPDRRAQEQRYAGARAREYSQPVPYVRGRDLAQYEPLPEPVPVNELYAARTEGYSRTQAYQTQSGPYYAASGASPVYNRTSVPAAPAVAQSAFISAPYTLEPSRTQPGMFEKVYEGNDGRGQPVPPYASPELTVARAQLQGSAPLARAIEVPLPTPDSFPVPIPELEPIRYSRAPAGRPPVPVAMAPAPALQQPQVWQPQPMPMPQPVPQQPQILPGAYSSYSHDWTGRPGSVPAPAPAVTPAAATQPEPYRTAPAMPLPVVAPVIQDWVASPTTAMR